MCARRPRVLLRHEVALALRVSEPCPRGKAGVPDDVSFRTRPEIARDQIRVALDAGTPGGTVLMDAGYGTGTDPRTALTDLGLASAAGIQPHTTVWPPGQGPLPPKPWSGRGRPASQYPRGRTTLQRAHRPIDARSLTLPAPPPRVPRPGW
ncbi:transposase [Methylobacterium platani]|uniref:transposase n=1 Tax=Methylobacterium platani TaxID=427683 RepID=UPI003CC91319